MPWLSKDGIKEQCDCVPSGIHLVTLRGSVWRPFQTNLSFLQSFEDLSISLYLHPYSSFVWSVAPWQLLIRDIKQGKENLHWKLEGILRGQSPEMNQKELHLYSNSGLKTCPDITVEGMTGMEGISGHSLLRTVSSKWEGHSLIRRESSMEELMDDQPWHLLFCF